MSDQAPTVGQGTPFLRADAQQMLRDLLPGYRPPPTDPKELDGDGPFVTRAQAAKFLGVHERTIFRRIEAGALRPCTDGRRRGVLREDVLALKRCDEDPPPIAINRETINRMDTELRVLKRELQMCWHVLDMRRWSLELSAEELVAKYHAAEKELAHGTESEWVDIVARVRWSDFETIERVTGDRHPWRTFWRLADRLTNTRAVQRSFELQRTLSAAARRLEEMSHGWIIVRHDEERLKASAAALLAESSKKK